ncbi:PilZ domain-containing protein [Oleiagrimonas sp.]|jgi:hypothetical protein|uniref:PilZ domain-containing protein n=1 Tax=Oleiagrimonas sp. TaxID=2010330 RepID=UPI002607899F|nr:PilZ domain-containing protein [Oleiagrimonas sp.]MDA3915036.1 PilZ domain-containing protein [Oleiagrimonas sp.]
MDRIDPDPSQREDRRAQRKSVESTEPAINVITGRVMGQIGNISNTGMLLICPDKPRSDAVYQITLPLPDNDEDTQMIEVGVQEQWHQQASSTENYWVGYRIVAITDEDKARLHAWLELPQ